MGCLAYFLILCGAFLELSTAKYVGEIGSSTTFDVTKFGAIGDGKKDDSKAFNSVWTSACNKSVGDVKIIVPSGKVFLVSPIKFEGPCKSSSITFQILGTVVAPSKQAWGNGNKDTWLYFSEVDGLSMVGNGKGLIDGQGATWWKDVKGGSESNGPTAIRFSHCNKLYVDGLTHKNSQKNHVSINQCNNANISNLHMTAPDGSPNTDGIDISSSTHLNIHDCIMETGDDCIAINGGTSNVDVSRITCGPGHGISIGSLGKDGKQDEVQGIKVQNCTFIKTQNGVRIKTWQGGSGFAKNITFKDIIFKEANNPVIIDQFYCPHKECSNKTSAVQVSDVNYIGLRGTVMTKNPTINLSCSQTRPCYNILLQNVNLTSATPNSKVYSRCINARGKSSAVSSPVVNCLQR